MRLEKIGLGKLASESGKIAETWVENSVASSRLLSRMRNAFSGHAIKTTRGVK
jgi:hypothetical protein